MNNKQRAALRRWSVRLVPILAFLLSLVFALASPGVADRRQVLIVLGTMCATLLGLMMTFVAFVYKIHVETLTKPPPPPEGVIRGVEGFWRTIFSVVIFLTTSVLASIFGLLESTVGSLPNLMVVAGFGLIYAVLTVPLLVGDMWGSIALAISVLPREHK